MVNSESTVKALLSISKELRDTFPIAAGVESSPNSSITSPDLSEVQQILSGFIGCSKVALPIARALQRELCDQFDVAIWDQMIFKPSQFPIESLEKVGTEIDFAILIVTPDDIRIKGGEEAFTPRDNVIFELGYFIGRLSRDRVFIVADKAHSLALPSDLGGITQVRYRMHVSGAIGPSIAPAATQIREVLDHHASKK